MGLLEPMHIILLLFTYFFFGIIFGAVSALIGRWKLIGPTRSFFWGFFLNIIGLVIVLTAANKNERSTTQFKPIPDQIKKYKELLDSRAISESEYNAQKSKLLNQ